MIVYIPCRPYHILNHPNPDLSYPFASSRMSGKRHCPCDADGGDPSPESALQKACTRTTLTVSRMDSSNHEVPYEAGDTILDVKKTYEGMTGIPTRAMQLYPTTGTAVTAGALANVVIVEEGLANGGGVTCLLSTGLSATCVFRGPFSDGGVFNHLATQGGTAPYANPHASGEVDSQSTNGTDAKHAQFVNFTQMADDTSNISTSDPHTELYYLVDLGEGRRLLATHYSLRHGCKRNVYPLRSWLFQGSNDGGQTWTTLREHIDDTSISGNAFATAAWEVDRGDGEGTSYRWFRILQQRRYPLPHPLCCSGLELYGDFQDEGIHVATPPLPNLQELPMPVLKHFLKSQGVSARGNKPALIARLGDGRDVSFADVTAAKDALRTKRNERDAARLMATERQKQFKDRVMAQRALVARNDAFALVRAHYRTQIGDMGAFVWARVGDTAGQFKRLFGEMRKLVN
jgi:hypothetical protein